MRRDAIEWRSGRVVAWQLDRLAPDRPPAAQADCLTEDLAQVAYPGGIVLDVGWYPARSARGSFAVAVVRAAAWDAPLFRVRRRTLAGLAAALVRAVAVADGAAPVRSSPRRAGGGWRSRR